jgi:hypothetical protein
VLNFEIKRRKKIFNEKLRRKFNICKKKNSWPQNGSKSIAVDENFELSQPPLEGVQCKRSSDHGASNAGKKQNK